ncbi:MAG: NlpC/P60 family protein [Gammaproteobacteria bacterium]|nr:NlpC/P60 family protein [Gammaproteobacteria bacterium]
MQYSLEQHFRRWQGTPHRLGGTGRMGIDCSAFVQITYQSLFGIELPRKTKHQSRVGRRIGYDSLSPGDLVFFKTGVLQRHVGIYLGNGQFMHASTSLGVTKTSLSSSYWARRYWKAVRLLPTLKQS